MIVNVSGNTPEDYAECAARIDELDNIPAIELNILKEEEVRYIGGIKHIGRKMMDASGTYYEVTWERTC
jgi:hypothetical protein